MLAIPRAAILFPGGAAYAYVAKGEGAYQRRRIQLGRQGDDRWEILGGLEEGERVVTSGNVLIDAQAQFNQGSDADDASGLQDDGTTDHKTQLGQPPPSALSPLPSPAPPPRALR